LAWQTLRGIVEELDVSEYVDLFSEKFPRFDEAWEALKWLLSRNPEPKGSALKIMPDGASRYRAYVLAGDPLAGTPDIWVVYTSTDSEVNIMGVNAQEIRPEMDEEDETD
jgi:hypothetical protein